MISFQNRGLLDLRALRSFGVSAKEGDNPIGMFGTGLKYALAILARERCTVELFIGLERFDFAAKQQQIRGQEFDFVTMNGEELGFTTKLGRNWQLWQAYRELHCNAIDEPEPLVTADDCEPREGYTTFRVYGDSFTDVYHQRGDIILEGKPKWVHAGVEIFDRPSAQFFYKGVAVGPLQKAASLTYNIVGHSIRLTEDRTVDWYWEPLNKIRDAIISSPFRELIERVVCSPEPDGFEGHALDFSHGGAEPSSVFMQFLESVPFRDVHNFSAVQRYKNHTGKAYMPDPTPLDDVEHEQLRRAKLFVTALGYPVDQDPVVVTSDLPEKIWACVYEGQIFLSRRIFMLGGTKLVAAALLEEHLHLRMGYKDETRELQTFLFNLVISLGERLRGEPL